MQRVLRTFFPNRGKTAPAMERTTVAEARAVALWLVYESMIYRDMGKLSEVSTSSKCPENWAEKGRT